MYSRHHNHFRNSPNHPDRGCVADQPQPHGSKTAHAQEGRCAQSLRDWTPRQLHAGLEALAVALFSLFSFTNQAIAGQPTTNAPPPAYQVLDRTPTNLILNFFKEQARVLLPNHAVAKSREEWERRRVELRRQL